MKRVRRPEGEPVDGAAVQDAGEVPDAGVEVGRECGHGENEVEFLSDHPDEEVKKLLAAAFRVERLVQLAFQSPHVLHNLAREVSVRFSVILSSSSSENVWDFTKVSF